MAEDIKVILMRVGVWAQAQAWVGVGLKEGGLCGWTFALCPTTVILRILLGARNGYAFV